MCTPKLDDGKVFVQFYQGRWSLIVEIIADEESLNISHDFLLQVFKEMGLKEETSP